MLTTTTWKERLEGRVAPDLSHEIDVFETQIELKRRGDLDDKVFAETRLRRGVYGQRYDNGQRHDGTASRTLAYPSGELTKGPNTIWDAPGMLRIKIPYGALTAEQLEVLAELAEETSGSIAHITTRQDVQLHFIHLEDTPDIMRRLAAVGITTQEACGNSVRNVTACPLSGVCSDETFDTTAYAHALTQFLLGHKDAQDFGRKVKIAFSGCGGHACGLANMHDIGLIARSREIEGVLQRGFRMLVGGGLGAVPHQAKELYDFLPAGELLPIAQAICRVFARLGEKRNRARARIKFLVAKIGIEQFRQLVEEERSRLPPDPRWTAFLDDLGSTDERPTRDASPLERDAVLPPGFAAWRQTNVVAQSQEHYCAVTVNLPLGDLTPRQLRALADITRTFNGGHLRASVEQNLVLRWIAENDLPLLHSHLDAAQLAAPGAGTLLDVTSCPGTDTCKLGISSSRGLASELRRRLQEQAFELDQSVQGLRIKVSGCFNSCGQHHVADIGFYGVSRKHEGRTVPHFQVVLGGQWIENAGSYGLATVAVPAKRIPEAVERITRLYTEQRQPSERFREFIDRVGKKSLRELLQDLTVLPTYADQPQLFSDWRDPREYTIGDLGVGECAGEVVSQIEFGLAAAERQLYEAMEKLDDGTAEGAMSRAYDAMIEAAKALARSEDIDLADDPQAIVERFRARFHDTGRFHDPFAGAKFANYLFAAHAERQADADGDSSADASPTSIEESAHRRIEEAQLFIEAAHACSQRLDAEAAAATSPTRVAAAR